MIFGADPEDWGTLIMAGLGDDLLPVVCNPQAKLSEHSTLKSIGKMPSQYYGSEVGGIKKWVSHMASAHELKRWSANPDYGICIITRQLRALDIDVGDTTTAMHISAAFQQALGRSLPIRYRENSGKRLLAFVVEGELPKRKFTVKGDFGIVEFLGDGQQFVACGTHVSGERYQWAGGLPDEFPVITVDQLDRAWSALVATYGEVGSDTSGGGPRRRGEALDLRDPVADWHHERGLVLEDFGDKLGVLCPWVKEHTTDNGPSQTVWHLAGTNGYEQGHFKCLHAHCDGRGRNEYLEAIGYVAADFEVLVPDADEQLPAIAPTFKRNKNGEIEAVVNNVLAALRSPEWTGTDFGWDDFTAQIMLSPYGKHQWRPFTDADYVALRSWLEQHDFKPIGRDLIRDAVLKVASERSFDSAIEWANSLPRWDGRPRVHQFLSVYFGADATEYAAAVSRYWLTAQAGRVLAPGCQADMVPVLVGPQGIYKSSALKALAPWGEAFAEINLAKKDDDLARKLRGKLICELAELRGLAGKAAEETKDWITRREEEWVPKYKEFTERFKRRMVVIGTTNRDDFLDDVTGNRRWLPVRVRGVDVDAVKRDRDQLWAEAIGIWRASGIDWAAAQELGESEHADFETTGNDAWQERVEQYLIALRRGGDSLEVVSSSDILTEALEFNTQKITRSDEMRLGDVLRKIGAERAKKYVNGVQRRVWDCSKTTFAQVVS